MTYRFAKARPSATLQDSICKCPNRWILPVTDHGMFLGLAKAAGDTSTEFSKTAFAEPYNGLNDEGNPGHRIFRCHAPLMTFSSFLPLVGGIHSGELDRDQVLDVVRTAWEDTIDAAEQFNDPGTFTAFVGYEYTPSGADMSNLHRNVIFKGTDALPKNPFLGNCSVNPRICGIDGSSGQRR